MTITIPPIRQKNILETNQMKEVVHRTLAVTASGGLCVWCGMARIGKTTTADYLVAELDKALTNGDPNAFRARYYSAGYISSKAGNPDRLGIVGLYEGSLGLTLDRGISMKSPEYLASMVVDNFITRKIRLVIVDEAGQLTPQALRGMVKVWDEAQHRGWPFTIVLIGMDKLPTIVNKYPQVRGRVLEWCYFKEYSFDETWELLREFHPHFRKLDPINKEDKELVAFIYETYGGVPGLILPFIHKFERRVIGWKDPITVKFLRSIHIATQKEQKEIVESAKREYKQSPQKEKNEVQAA